MGDWPIVYVQRPLGVAVWRWSMRSMRATSVEGGEMEERRDDADC
jgi:hypothetical protein